MTAALRTLVLLTTEPASPVTQWMIAQLSHRPGWSLVVSTDGDLPPGQIDRAILRMYAREGRSDGSQADLRATHAHPSLRAASQLEAAGIRVVNGARSNFLTCDKLACNAVLAAAGIDVMPAWCAHRPHGRIEPSPAGWIAKPRWGELGDGVVMHHDLQGALKAADAADEPQIIQHFLPGARCYRVTASPTRVLGSWEKQVDDPNQTPVASVATGAVQVSVDAYRLGIDQLAARAVAAVGGDMMGVDVLVGEDGRMIVLEVNCAPGGLADAPANEQEAFLACMLGEL